MGLFTTSIRNKNISQIVNKNTSPYFYSVFLVVWPLTVLKGTHFTELSITTHKRCPRVHTPFPDARSEKRNPGSKLLGGQKFNVESELIYCSLISIHYQLNPSRETNAELLFASKIFSLDVPNDSPYTFTTHDRWKPARQPCLLCKPRLARDHTVTWHRGSRTSRSCNYCCSPNPRG